MDNNVLEEITSPIINKLYSLCWAIVPNELEAEQLLVDSYTRFVVKDKDFIIETKIDDSADKNHFSDYVLSRIVQEVYSLSKKRTNLYTYSKRENLYEFNSFYKLNLIDRIIIHLSQNLEFSEAKIAEILFLKKHEVVKSIFIAKNELLDIKETRV